MKFASVPTPIPKADEVLVKIKYTSVTHGDIRMRAADPYLARLHSGLLRPKRYPILGFECSGVVDKVGKDVKNYCMGDEVIVFAGLGFGAYAEYITVPESGNMKKGLIVKKPENISFEEAAVVPVGGITALSFLKDLGVETKDGQKLLILGASGSVGTYAVQLAKYFGVHVTALTSLKNFGLMEHLGVDLALSYEEDDWLKMNDHFDMIFDAVGLYKTSKLKKLLKKDGMIKSVKGSVKNTDNNLNQLADLLASGHLKPVISEHYSWEELATAHKHVDSGRKVGNVSIKVS